MIDECADDSDKDTVDAYKLFKTTEVITTTKIYLSDSFSAPMDYIPIFEMLDSAKETDKFIFYLNSYGGRVDAGIQFASKLSKTKAHTKSVVEAPCYSMGAIFPFLTKEVEMHPHTFLMFHQASSGFGRQKINDIAANLDTFSGLFKSILVKYCSRVLTTKEIEGICDGKDVYLLDTDVKKRLAKNNEK